MYFPSGDVDWSAVCNLALPNLPCLPGCAAQLHNTDSGLDSNLIPSVSMLTFYHYPVQPLIRRNSYYGGQGIIPQEYF